MTPEEALGEGRDQSLPEHNDPMALAVAELQLAIVIDEAHDIDA